MESLSTSNMDSFHKLDKLARRQASLTDTFPKKLWQFLRIVLLGHSNSLEQFVAENEPNDCALTSKFYHCTRIDLSHQPSLSVDHVFLRTARIPHPLTNFLKKDPPAGLDKELRESPVVVFIHGLGGQMSQFEPLMQLLSQCSEIMALDLPGFGDSRAKAANLSRLASISDDEHRQIGVSVDRMSDGDFSSDNIANIIVEYITQSTDPDKKVVLIGHSMGTHLAVRVANKLEPHKVEGLVLLSPPDFSEPDSPNRKISFFSGLSLRFPALINLFRVWDKLEGLSSHSVSRQLADTSGISPNSLLYHQLRQFRWNMEVSTKYLLKYVQGFRKVSKTELVAAIQKFNDNPFDKTIYEKTLLVCGAKDKVTTSKQANAVHDYLTHTFQRQVSSFLDVKNAGHALMLTKPELVGGKVLNHIEHKFPSRLHLSPAWVLRVKADISGDKWGLKNELKWSKLEPISTNIVRGTEVSPLLGMKTLREGDENHSPSILEQIFYGPAQTSRWKGHLIAIVDISHDIPPYNPESFDNIKYYKCATVSKVVPDPSSIRKFINLIDEIIKTSSVQDPLIAVHCHYGFNRTGFLIACYLIEKLGWSVEEAVSGFKLAKPPGIKHQHFIDALYVRYEG